jgi:hypothetical protein
MEDTPGRRTRPGHPAAMLTLTKAAADVARPPLRAARVAP